MADGHVLADHGGEAAELGVRAIVADMDHGAVLDIGARTDADEVDVAADDGARPDRHVVAQHHVADHGRGGIDVAACAEGRQDAFVGSDMHAAIVVRRPGTAMPILGA